MPVLNMIERSATAIRSVLAAASPQEARRFEREWWELLTDATGSAGLDLDEVLSRWWGIAILRAHPPKKSDRESLQQLRTDTATGWARQQGRRPTPHRQRRYTLWWANEALDDFLRLSRQQQRHLQDRLHELLHNPAGAHRHYDESSNLWFTTDGAAGGLVIYDLRPDPHQLVVMRVHSHGFQQSHRHRTSQNS